MPKKVDIYDGLTIKWNLYVNTLDKLEFIRQLKISGKNRAQSAAMRALMYLYAKDEEVRKKVNDIVDDFIVYKQDGTTSCL